MLKEKIKTVLGKISETIRGIPGRIRTAWQTRDERTLRRSALITTVLFSLLLIWVLFLKLGIPRLIYQNYINLSQFDLEGRFMYNLDPFELHGINIVKQIFDISCNCLVFAPFGLFFSVIFKKRCIPRDVLLCFLISLTVEVTQLFTMLGGFATIDLITNTVSYFVGLAFYYLIFKRLTTASGVIFLRTVSFIMLAILPYALYTVIENYDLIVGVLTRSI